MHSRLILIVWGALLLSIFLSILVHYQSPKTSQLQAPNLSSKELTKPKSTWEASLSKLTQFKKPNAIPSIENTRINDIKSGKLVGIILDTPSRAIVMSPESGKVLRVVVGEGWLPGWTLMEARANHVIWKEDSTQKQYKQMLFTATKKK